MSITFDLPVHTDHPTTGPPVTPAHFGYDPVGNMTSRTMDGVSYTLTYDAENRLISVIGGGSTSVFTYDGDGNRVKGVQADEQSASTTVTTTSTYVGNYYEQLVEECVGPDCAIHVDEMECPEGATCATKYYYADGQLVAFERLPDYAPEPYGMRYVFRDHLGSNSVIVSGGGVDLWEDRYLPYGDVRYTSRKGDDPSFPVQTQYRYTGQWFEDGLGASAEDGLDRGLYFYGARWYDSSLGRFIQPDTIVPEPGNPQSLNRYSYVNNRPTVYIDPSGYRLEEGAGFEMCGGIGCVYPEGHPLAGYLIGTEPPWGPGQHADDNWVDLGFDWLLEHGPETRVFGEGDYMVDTLKNHPGVSDARALLNHIELEPGKTHTHKHDFGLLGYAMAWVTFDGTGHFLGSYDVLMTVNESDTVTFRVINQSDLASFTNIRTSKDDISLEERVLSGELPFLPYPYPLVVPIPTFKTILADRPRPGLFGYGGNFIQVYIWTENIPH